MQVTVFKEFKDEFWFLSTFKNINFFKEFNDEWEAWITYRLYEEQPANRAAHERRLSMSLCVKLLPVTSTQHKPKHSGRS